MFQNSSFVSFQHDHNHRDTKTYLDVWNPESKHGYHTHAHRGEVPRDVDITSTFKRHHVTRHVQKAPGTILQTSDANKKVAIPKISCYLSSLQIKARVPPHKHGGKVHVMLTLRERSKFITCIIPISIKFSSTQKHRHTKGTLMLDTQKSTVLQTQTMLISEIR